MRPVSAPELGDPHVDRRALIRKYRETPRPAGVYRVTHLRTGRVLLGSSPDATAMLNRLRIQLTLWSHPNGALQADWDGDGADGFALDVVDFLPPSDDPDRNIVDDLQTLLSLWENQLSLLPEDR